MAIGTLEWSGQATCAAGTPGVAGYIDVALASVGATDIIVATPSAVASQTMQEIKGENLTFQIIKTAGTGFKILCNQKQNPAVVFDYIVMVTSA